MQPAAGSTRSILLLILFAFTTLPGLLLFLASQAHPTQAQGLPQMLVIWAAAVSTVGAAAVVMIRLKPIAPPEQFKVSVLTALALAEFASMIRFVNQISGGGSMLPYAAANWAVIFLLVLPRVLQYEAA